MNSSNWIDNYNLLKAYYEKTHNTLLIRNYTINGINLYTWLLKQIDQSANNTLEEDKKNLLDNLDPMWNASRFDKAYTLAQEYYNEFRTINISRKIVYHGFKLGRWRHAVKKDYRDGRLTPNQIDKLKKLNFDFEIRLVQAKKIWEERYAIAKEYYLEFGDLYVKPSETYKKFDLGDWLTDQRRIKSQGLLPKQREKLLDEIEMIWNLVEYAWQRQYEACKDFYQKHGHLFLPVDYSVIGVNTYKWLNVQRMHFNQGILDPKKKQLLDKIGMYWNKEQKDQKLWDIKYKICKKYYKKHKHLNVPNEYTVDNMRIDVWLANQKDLQRHGNLPKEQERLLEEIGIVWDRKIIEREDQWENSYKIAEAYYKEHGNLLVSRDYKVGDFALGRWIATQRLNKDTMSKERKDKLDAIGMVWQLLEKKRLSWEEAYAIARDYYIEHGNLFARQGQIYHDFGIGNWIANQQFHYREGKLTEEQINLLNRLEFPWNLKTKKQIIELKEKRLAKIRLQKEKIEKQLYKTLKEYNNYYFNTLDDVNKIVDETLAKVYR